ncbi:archaellin/type IV pilin N-terminal domain-containing protein [Sulfolobaceae archaeon RB850M]
MSRKKKGVSSILGAIIFIQIVILSLVILLSIQQKFTTETEQVIQKLNYYSQNSPLEIVYKNGEYYVVSVSPNIIITYLIYPGGKIIKKEITLPIQVINILNGSKWVIAVTNDGTWYNITELDLGNSNSLSPIIIGPAFTSYGEPVKGPYPVSLALNWDYIIFGIGNPSPTSLVFINYTSPWGYKYNYGLTNATAIINATQAKWLNLTLMEYSVNNFLGGIVPITSLYIPFNTSAGLYYTWMSFDLCYSTYWTNGSMKFSGLLPLSNTGNSNNINTTSRQIQGRVPGVYPLDQWQVENIDINLFNHYVLMYIYKNPYYYSAYYYTTKGWILVANYTYIIGYPVTWYPYYEPIKYVPLQGYPIYIVVPENVYLLEISYN